jgi:hypothetical protein
MFKYAFVREYFVSLVTLRRILRRLVKVIYNPAALIEEELVAPDILSSIIAFIIFLMLSLFKSYMSATRIIEVNGAFGNTFQYYSYEFIIYFVEGIVLVLFSTMLLVLISVKHENYKVFFLFSFYLLVIVGLGRLISGGMLLIFPKIQFTYTNQTALSSQFQNALLQWAQANSIPYIIDVVISDVIPITWCIVLQSYAASRLMNANRMAAIFMLISTWVGLRVIIMRALITILYGIPFI